jgi:hypothetical protein
MLMLRTPRLDMKQLLGLRSTSAHFFPGTTFLLQAHHKLVEQHQNRQQQQERWRLHGSLQDSVEKKR